MNNKNKESFNNGIETNVSEENIILAAPTELFDEASKIAQNTISDENSLLYFNTTPTKKNYYYPYSEH